MGGTDEDLPAQLIRCQPCRMDVIQQRQRDVSVRSHYDFGRHVLLVPELDGENVARADDIRRLIGRRRLDPGLHMRRCVREDNGRAHDDAARSKRWPDHVILTRSQCKRTATEIHLQTATMRGWPADAGAEGGLVSDNCLPGGCLFWRGDCVIHAPNACDPSALRRLRCYTPEVSPVT